MREKVRGLGRQRETLKAERKKETGGFPLTTSKIPSYNVSFLPVSFFSTQLINDLFSSI